MLFRHHAYVLYHWEDIYFLDSAYRAISWVIFIHYRLPSHGVGNVAKIPSHDVIMVSDDWGLYLLILETYTFHMYSYWSVPSYHNPTSHYPLSLFAFRPGIEADDICRCIALWDILFEGGDLKRHEIWSISRQASQYEWDQNKRRQQSYVGGESEQLLMMNH